MPNLTVSAAVDAFMQSANQAAMKTAIGVGTIASGTTNKIPKYTGSTTIGDSALSDDGTTLSYAGTGGISLASGSTAGAVELGQGTTQSLGTNSVIIQAPTSVTSYKKTIESSAGSTGVYVGVVSGTDVVESKIAPGSNGNVLQSDGTNWVSQPLAVAPSGKVVLVANCAYYSPSASTTEYIGSWPASPPRGTDAIASFQIPVSGTITAAFASHRQDGGTTGSGGTNAPVITIMKNGSAQASSAVTLNTGSASSNGSATGLSIAVTAGDTISFRIQTPAWSVTPTVLIFQAQAVITL